MISSFSRHLRVKKFYFTNSLLNMPTLASGQSPAADPDAATQQSQPPQPQQSTQQRRFLPGMTKDHQGTFFASRQEKTEGRPHSTKKAEGCQQTQYHIPYHTAPPFPNLCPGRAVCSCDSVQYFYGLEKGFDKKVSKNSHRKTPPPAKRWGWFPYTFR